MHTEEQNLKVVFDVDLCAFLIINGTSIASITQEAGRVAFHFPADDVDMSQAALSSGKARVEPCRWSSIVRRLHQDYLSPAAKTAMRSQAKNNVN